jgi:hypothetical protein
MGREERAGLLSMAARKMLRPPIAFKPHGAGSRVAEDQATAGSCNLRANVECGVLAHMPD